MPVSDDDSFSDPVSEEEFPTMKPAGVGRDTNRVCVNRVVSDDGATYDDSDEDDDDNEDNPRSSSLRNKSNQKRISHNKDSEPSLPRRAHNGRTRIDKKDDEDFMVKPRESRSSSIAGSEPSSGGDSVDRPTKAKRHGTKSEIEAVGAEDSDEIKTDSFHKLAKDADKKLGSKSRGHKTKRSGSTRISGRRSKERTDEMSDVAVDIDEFGEEEHEVDLKGEDSDNDGNLPEGEPKLLPSGRRPPTSRRGQLLRGNSSERFRRAVEGESEEGDDRGQSLSRSAHGSTRRRSGSTDSLGSGSYHGSSERSRTRTPNKRRPRRTNHPPNSDGSGENFEHEMSLSGRSSRTLDSIEDLEDFEHVDFQTPGMINYDAEILELMQKANPEHTAQLQRRVGRRREAVNYDQNMPMMTRQALMTRTASSQVQRQFVDQSNLDKRNMLLRSMSSSSMSAEEISMSQNRQQVARPVPSRRPPPRTRSSGMALSISEHPADDKRRLFRTKSGASTSSFRQTQKPNRVQPISRRSGEMDGSRSNRGAPEDRNGSLSRAKSMHATVGRTVSPKKPERRVPKAVESKAAQETSGEKHPPKDDSSMSEDSDVESDEEGTAIVTPRRKIPPPMKAAPKPVMPPKQKTDKRDFTVRRNRAKLHSMLYESKMGVDMHDLLETVRLGEVLRSPWKALMMPSP